MINITFNSPANSLNTYMSWMNPATYIDVTAQVTGATTGTDWFNMGTWSKMFQASPKANTEQNEG